MQFFQGNQLPEILTMKSLRESSDVLDANAEFFTYNLDGDYWLYATSLSG